MSNNALVELRNFSNSCFAQSEPRLLGGAQALTLQYVCRILGPTGNDEHLMGNWVEGGSPAGWRLLRRPGTHEINFTFEIVEGGVVQSIDFSCPAIWGAVLAISIGYAHGTPGVISVFLNGVNKKAQPTTNNLMSVALLTRFSIGYDVNNSQNEAINTSFIGAGYTTASNFDFSDNALETEKRADITSGGLPLPWMYEYSAPRSSGVGVPSTLANFGTAAAPPSAALTVLGTPIVGTPPFIWDTSVAAANASSGVTGTGTDNHLVRWDGTGVPVIQDSTWILDDTGNMTVPTNINMATTPNLEGVNETANLLTIHGSDGIDQAVLPADFKFAGSLKIRGGNGASALTSGNGRNGGWLTGSGGDGGNTALGTAGAGGSVIFTSGGRLDSPAPVQERSVIEFDSSVYPYLGARVFLLGGSLFDTGVEGVLGAFAMFSGAGLENRGAPQTQGGNFTVQAGSASSSINTATHGGNVTLISGPMSTNKIVGSPGSPGAVYIGAARAQVNGDLVGNLSGNIILGLSVAPGSLEAGGFASYDGGFNMSGVDGIVYWANHDISPTSSGGDNVVGSQRLHAMTRAQELVLEPLFPLSIPGEGFFHFVEGLAADADNAMQYGFRGYRHGYTRSMARIYTRVITPADVVANVITIDHKLNSVAPVVQVWKYDNATNIASLCIQGVEYSIVRADLSVPDGMEKLQIVCVAPPTAPNWWYVTVAGY